MQDSPPGAATAALLARTEEVPPGWLEGALEAREVVALYNARTATAILPAADAAAYGTALLPRDDAGLKAIVGPALPDKTEGFAEAVELGVAGISDALDGRTLSRDALHEALRRRLPPELLPWCPGCRSNHARRGLLVMASLNGRLCIAGRAGRQPAFARTDQLVGWTPPPAGTARAELARRYLSAYGPSTPAHLAQWTGAGNAHARELLASVADEMTDIAGIGKLLTRDLEALEHPPATTGARLIAPGDPLLLGRDREALLPDAEARKRVWRAVAGAGVVLSDGQTAATWRARKQGRRLEVSIERIAAANQGQPDPDALQAEADRLAPHRGCTSATLAAQSV